MVANLLRAALRRLEHSIYTDALSPTNWHYMRENFGDVIWYYNLPRESIAALLLIQYLGSNAPEREAARLTADIAPLLQRLGSLSFAEYHKDENDENAGLQDSILRKGDCLCFVIVRGLLKMPREAQDQVFEIVREKHLHDLDADIYDNYKGRIQQQLAARSGEKRVYVRMLILMWWLRSVIYCLFPEKRFEAKRG